MRPSGSKRYPRSWSGKGGNRENHTPSNLCTLCRSCHSRKTVRENGGFGRKRRRVLQ